jgi:Group II intron, maturase-specific domain
MVARERTAIPGTSRINRTKPNSAIKRAAGYRRHAVFRRRLAVKLRDMIDVLNPIIRGWRNYYRNANVRWLFHRLDGWIERRLGCDGFDDVALRNEMGRQVNLDGPTKCSLSANLSNPSLPCHRLASAHVQFPSSAARRPSLQW